ncbi:MAG: hypothetical protein Q9186_002859 [Xanthomendoza sp. 1 TL-2023]
MLSNGHVPLIETKNGACAESRSPVQHKASGPETSNEPITPHLPIGVPSGIRKRPRSEEVEETQENSTGLPASTTKRAKAQPLTKSGPDSVPFWGVQAIKPLTEANLNRFQDSMSNSDQHISHVSRQNSAKYRRVSGLSSSKRSHSLMDLQSNASMSSRACAANSPRFEKHLKDCCYDIKGAEKPDPNDLEEWRKVMAQKRESPEPDAELFHLTREQVKSKNEVSVVKRLSPMLFPYRDLPINNQKTNNLVYIDDSQWIEWGSIKPGYLPIPKPDLTIAFKEESFTTAELERMISPYILATSYAPFFTLEIKTIEQMGIAEKQNANNMIPLLQRDFTLQKANNTHKEYERKVRCVSSTHDTAIQRFHAWFYVIEAGGNPKWCCTELDTVTFTNPHSNGFQTARQYNLNLCEYISDTMFKQLRNTLAGRISHDDPTQVDVRQDLPDVHASIGHLNTPATSSTGEPNDKRPKQ